MAGVKPSAISSETVAAFKTKLGYLTQAEADLRYPQISEGEPVDLDALLAAKADLASPTFTGTPLVPTPSIGTATTQVTNTEFLKTNGYGRLIYSNNVQHLHTGTTNETELFNFTIPENSLGANGSLQFIFKVQSTSATTGTKYIRIKNGSSVLGFILINSATLQIGKCLSTTENRNSTSSQISSNNSFSSPANNAFTLTNIDTTQPWTISVTGQLGVGTENVSIESLSVIAFYKD